ncbi:uncharacterized protein LACBIDRAFT_298393 [Laccaria bicolor S238N-H82]|uniref:Predicted protein n=1 Tax=Laccaria bicolor (strain S238N-H82 / ATCC MYA-4686) TaxID=486041 RepID=B0DCR2_LACBS|nr:uncharacterized protein LACBIDRAFT_298393 [Laccaria bicolor S238N-H82]EDR07337.1 predicted protein [Laccaria bicolor S238N-H82]|eukprot:XP_001881729.1 predicted protein [Laccaria bicolor S238N-H82]
MKLPWFSGSEETLISTAQDSASTPKAPPLDATIPPALPGRARTLVLCFDGTGDKDDTDRTNVVELKVMLKVAEEEQLVYYQQGIGTYTPRIPGVKEPMKIPGVSYLSEEWDKATAWSLRRHVIGEQAYLWLVDHYTPGDKICMFGFSRGSYTARALAGMLFKVGLLPKEHRKEADAAFESYKVAETKEGWEHSRAFQKVLECRKVSIEFLGCWDTVNSVGYWTTKSLPFTAYNPMVRVFRHAVALDERRAKFRTNLWSPNNKILTGTDDSDLSDYQKVVKNFVEEQSKGLPTTHVDEVWFSGCHCDIGGGAVLNGTKPNLAHISLRWMIRQCFMQNTGIMFLNDKLETFHLSPDSLYPKVKDRPSPVAMKGNKIQPPTRLGPIDTVKGWVTYLNPFRPASVVPRTVPRPKNEEEADGIDALAPIYDMLDIKPQMWLIFENMPLKVYDIKLGKYVYKKFNKLPRSLRGPIFVDFAKKVTTQARVRVHRTVLARMNALHADGSPYVPRALFPDKKAISLDAGLTGNESNFEWVD